jgi:hypothetical protein
VRAALPGSLALALAVALAAPAFALVNASVELEAPGGGFEGAALTHVTFHMDDANGPIVGEWSGFLFTADGLVRSVFTVIDDPGALDAMRVEFVSPLTAALTTLVVDPLVFPIEFFLPNPSDGSEIAIPPTTPGAPGDNAVVRVSVESVVAGADQTAPTCRITRTGPTVAAELTDAASGLASIEIEWASNLSISVPAFAPGTAEVAFDGSVLEPEQTVTLILDVYDVAGNRSLCKSVSQLSGGSGGVPPAGGGGANPFGQAVPSLAPGALVALTAFLVAAAGLGLSRRR